MGRVGPVPKRSKIQLIKGVIRFGPDIQKEFASILNLPFPSEQLSKAVEEVGITLTKYPELIATLDHQPRPAHRKADLRPLREQCEKTIHDLDNMSAPNFADLLQGYTLTTPLEIDDEAWTYNLESRERRNDLQHKILTIQQHLSSLIQDMDACIQQYYNKESRHRPPKKARKQLCDNLLSIFSAFYQSDPDDDPEEAKIDFLRVAFCAFNQVNPLLSIPVDSLPTTRRAIRSLLKQTYPSEPIKVRSHVL